MNHLIPTQENEDGNLLVSGRNLHEFLEVKTAYKDWFPRMVGYGFLEGQDFSSFMSESTGGRPSQDHLIKIDMAKEISMIQRSDKGKEARQYFLEIERRWNSPEMILKRAQDYLTAKVAKLETSNLVLEQQVQEFKPKASYYDTVLQNKSLLSITRIAKDYGMSGTKMNRLLHELGVQYRQGDIWLLYARHQDKGFTQTSTHIINAEKSKITTKWTQKGRLFIYDLLKNEGVLPMIEREEGA